MINGKVELVIDEEIDVEINEDARFLQSGFDKRKKLKERKSFLIEKAL